MRNFNLTAAGCCEKFNNLTEVTQEFKVLLSKQVCIYFILLILFLIKEKLQKHRGTLNDFV